ncbi:flagellar protein FlgN [Paenibacillus senegalimassiliensis]|uniref:flagellar protein FlgN n=1 Tax=Paenibacillus senegalimassiliensis TaxID=1737426 RepID=UPI00073E581D|nr:flagellar protein FlgN [Paenibacillus senegalimassiliensis]
MSVQLLIDSLTQLDAGYVDLLQLMEEKKQTILSRNFDELVRILNRESKLLKQIDEQEQRLLDAAQQFLKEKGIKSQLELTVSEILRLVFDPEEKSQLEQIRQQLGQRLTELKRVNELNQALIQQSLSFIDFSLNLMIGNEEDEVTYSPPTTQDKKAASRRMFDTRA